MISNASIHKPATIHDRTVETHDAMEAFILTEATVGTLGFEAQQFMDGFNLSFQNGKKPFDVSLFMTFLIPMMLKLP
jgi:hypothetical protein